jgi:hypothetical protein
MRVSALVDLLFFCSAQENGDDRARARGDAPTVKGADEGGERGGHWWSTAWRAREEKRWLLAALKAAGRHGLSLHLRLDRVRSVLPCEKNEHGAYSSGLPSSWPPTDPIEQTSRRWETKISVQQPPVAPQMSLAEGFQPSSTSRAFFYKHSIFT